MSRRVRGHALQVMLLATSAGCHGDDDGAVILNQLQHGGYGSGSDIVGAGSATPPGSLQATGSAGELPHIVPHGAVSFELSDAATGKRMPGKITFVGVKGTSDPRLSKGDIGDEEGNSLEAYNRVFTLDGTGVVEMPVGTYDVTFSRGLEWTISTQRLTLAGPGVELHAKLEHVVDTPHWVSGDFHVHAASSPDSHVPMRDRVYEFVAEGVDMIVSTDHNVVSNYQPVIEDLHAEKLLASATGDEITTADWGHFGAFPLATPRDESEGQGAIAVHNKTAAEIFRQVREASPDAVIDVHHPRLDRRIGYFYLGKFDDQRDTSTRKGFSYDFDAIEILNGYQDTNRRTIDRVMTDWFALLDRGHIVTATGNSDTHHMTYNLGGYPRNYVLVDNDDPAVVKGADVARSVKAHHAFFTTGPIVGFTSGSKGIGDVALAPKGKATVDVTVRAAPWVSVSRVMLYVGGVVVKKWDVPPSEKVDRFHVGYELSLTTDTYAVIRVEGDRPLAPIVGDVQNVRVTPFALTNPIFFDVDGNGAYDPPLHHGPHDSSP